MKDLAAYYQINVNIIEHLYWVTKCNNHYFFKTHFNSEINFNNINITVNPSSFYLNDASIEKVEFKNSKETEEALKNTYENIKLLFLNS